MTNIISPSISITLSTMNNVAPVKSRAAIIKRTLSYEGASPLTTVNTYKDFKGTFKQVTSKMLLDCLCAVVCFVDKDVLAYKASKIGTHSIRSTAAMAIYLSGIPVFTIMLIGRFLSDAFLLYIHPQVQQFSFGVSNQMISSPDFFMIPDFTSREDPCISKHARNFAAHSNTGPDAQYIVQ
jgi:hypothetical protein